MKTARPLRTKFFERTLVTPYHWLWTGSIRDKSRLNQYGTVPAFGRKHFAAHRLSYLLHYGELDDTLVIDHICFFTLCVNPDHLEQITAEENVTRWARTVTSCPHGHEYSEKNTGIYNGSRYCKTCRRQYAAAKLIKEGNAKEKD